MAVATEPKSKELPIPGRPYAVGVRKRLRSKLKGMFREQYADAMAILDREAGRKMIGQLEPSWRSMFTTDKLKLWADDVYPEVEAGFKAGAKTGIRDIKVQLDDLDRSDVKLSIWDVEQPGARVAVQQAAWDLSRTTNEVTQRQLDRLIPKFRAEVIQGIATGEPYDWMAGKIKDLFGHADKYRSQRIAITETQRAIHQGLLHQYAESGVVEATQWLTSGAPCPICEAIALENEQGIALFKEYANDGKGGTYSSVAAPPAHPGCLCSLFPILIPVERMPRYGNAA